MENIRDWCISRQLWWGHRIPAYYCDGCGEITVTLNAPEKCPKCGGPVRQDEDVLDTWFSSGMWPFSTLGWPDSRELLDYFYPTSTLVTGYDIIFFWIARMIVFGMEVQKQIPFHTVYVHGIIRDESGQKDEQVTGQRHRPIGNHQGQRRGFPALQPHYGQQRRQRHALLQQEGGVRPELLQQDLQRQPASCS